MYVVIILHSKISVELVRFGNRNRRIFPIPTQPQSRAAPSTLKWILLELQAGVSLGLMLMCREMAAERGFEAKFQLYFKAGQTGR